VPLSRPAPWQDRQALRRSPCTVPPLGFGHDAGSGHASRAVRSRRVADLLDRLEGRDRPVPGLEAAAGVV